jgi:hypothetical protein
MKSGRILNVLLSAALLFVTYVCIKQADVIARQRLLIATLYADEKALWQFINSGACIHDSNN